MEHRGPFETRSIRKSQAAAGSSEGAEPDSVRTKSQRIVFSWFTKHESWDKGENDSSVFFGFSKHSSLVGEEKTRVERPAYVNFGKELVFIDVPFSQVKYVENLEEELGPWGIGKVGKAYTYHLVFGHDQIVQSPQASLGLVNIVLDFAAQRDYELTGKITFRVDQD